MKFATNVIAIAAVLCPGLAAAQNSAPATSMPSERRLSPEQIEAVLKEAADKNRTRDQRATPDVQPEAPKPQVHGEFGVSVGTGGYREVFGTAVVPMGEDGAAAVSMDFVDFGRRRYKR